LYHRGHAIPHTLGGATDINLVPQLGAVNVGAFRALERAAVATPGALYFTYWSYRGSRLRTARGHDEPGQVPTAVEQGLRDAFAASLAASRDPQVVAAQTAGLLGRGCIVTVEAERAGWSRYRVAVRGFLLGQGAPVTIATVEVTRPD